MASPPAPIPERGPRVASLVPAMTELCWAWSPLWPIKTNLDANGLVPLQSRQLPLPHVKRKDPPESNNAPGVPPRRRIFRPTRIEKLPNTRRSHRALPPWSRKKGPRMVHPIQHPTTWSGAPIEERRQVRAPVQYPEVYFK